jgi:hypothetical protein
MGDCKVHERVISQTQGSDGFLVVSSGRGLLARWRANNIAFQVSITAKQKTFRTENIGNVTTMETALTGPRLIHPFQDQDVPEFPRSCAMDRRHAPENIP